MQACPAALYYMYKIIEHCKYGDLFLNSKEIWQEKTPCHSNQNDKAFWQEHRSVLK